MNIIFQHECYKEYLKDFASHLPNGGRGFFKSISDHLGISSTMTSQVINGEKHFSQENMVDLAEFLKLSNHETDFLFIIHDFSRTTHQKLKDRLFQKMLKARDFALQLDSKLAVDDVLGPVGQSIYYSDVIYGLVRGLAILPSFEDAEELAKHIQRPVVEVQAALDFLLKQGILKLSSDGLSFGSGVTRTHLSSTSPLVLHHHRNWRLLSVSTMKVNEQKNLFFTAPMTMSREVAMQIRKELPDFIQHVVERVAASESEVMYALNVDWFEISKAEKSST